MTDDIAARLRCGDTTAVFDAADEIDRLRVELEKIASYKNNQIRLLRQSYVTLAFAFNRLHQSSRSRDGELCLDLQRVRSQIEGHFKTIGVNL